MSTEAEFASGVIACCDDCGRVTVTQAVYDDDDPLGWAIAAWICRPCSIDEDQRPAVAVAARPAVDEAPR